MAAEIGEINDINLYSMKWNIDRYVTQLTTCTMQAKLYHAWSIWSLDEKYGIMVSCSIPPSVHVYIYIYIYTCLLCVYIYTHVFSLCINIYIYISKTFLPNLPFLCKTLGPEELLTLLETTFFSSSLGSVLWFTFQTARSIYIYIHVYANPENYPFNICLVSSLL